MTTITPAAALKIANRLRSLELEIDGAARSSARLPADILYAPVVSRILTYDLPVSDGARDYCAAVRAQPFVAQWYDEAAAEPWVLDQFETGPLPE